MTTIAYKNGVIAYDSRVTKESLICDDDYDKHVERDGIHFFMTGAIDKVDDIVKAWFKEDYDKSICPISPVMVWDGTTLYEFGLYKEGRLSLSKNTPNKPFALGSGEDHALTAMDMGATAYEAVAMTIKRDTYTGGKIRTFNIAEKV